MRGRQFAAALLGIAAIACPAHATVGAADVVPAATLLLPYFEVGLDEANSNINTRFSVTNFNAAATLIHVMIFTDYSVGTLAFDVYLTGYDVQSFNLRQLFMGDGELDPCIDGIFSGPSAPDFFPPCESPLALMQESPPAAPPAPPISKIFDENFESGSLDRWTLVESRVSEMSLQALHTGGATSDGNLCAGMDHGDNIARGYVLIDVSDRLAGDVFPEAENYFQSDLAAPIAGTRNVLIGDYELRNGPRAFRNSLVHIESTTPQSNFKGPDPTFYARYTNSDADMREPLGSKWAARYENGGAFADGASIMYWRDPEVVQQPFPCGNPPDWSPLPQAFVAVFDEDSNGVELEGVTPFPLACGRVAFGSTELSSPSDFGWLYVDFGAVNTIGGSSNQAVILTSFTAAGRFGVGHFGIPFESAPTNPADILMK